MNARRNERVGPRGPEIKMIYRNNLLFYSLFWLALPASLHGQHWNQFRGSLGDGISDQRNFPVNFTEGDNIRWKIAIPDSGWSSPVVWENEIWLTVGDDRKKELRALCVDLESGEIKKDIKVFDMVERLLDAEYIYDSPHLNSPATPTSIVESDSVYVSFGSQGIARLDRLSGEMVWSRRDLRVYQPVRQGSSPIVDDQNLYVAYDGTDQQFFVALDKESGETKWRVARDVDTDWKQTLRGRGIQSDKGGKPNDNKKAFSTATLIDVEGKRQLIAPAAEAIISYEPETGEELWRTVHPGGFNVAARPIYSNDLVYVFTSGLDNSLMAIRPDGRGDVTETHVVWKTRGPNIPSPVLSNGLLFMVTDKGGIVRCLDAKTGEELWKMRVGGDHWASPILVGGNLLFSNKQGEVTILPATREEPEVIARNELKASFVASPAVTHAGLILRSTTHLYCVAEGFGRTQEQIASDVYPDEATPVQKSRVTDKESRLDELVANLRVMVKAGKLTREEAADLYRAAANISKKESDQ